MGAPGAPQTQVSEADLIAAVTRIEDAAERLRGIQRQLDQAGVNLKVHWVGQSEAAFDAVHKKWHERMDVILGSLRRLADNIGTSNKNYKAFNQERTEAINQISNLINAQFNSRI
ncbi:WXG100 family type VII secretion target [Nonomuraea angiospora]|uniref:WXG100 family type VII secretion target n=1 Tax=Nonomuraea angiospora TaxID=46172 RepID=UPI0029A9E49E|nr:WXG100 family type VII secretion target [Nonomuraea angiospora]MDX3106276.1 WXG100 family type VII secretion target [Nonomuraea angiospora]